MLKSIRNHIAAFQIALLFIILITPATVSCQRRHAQADGGIGELQSLVARSSGKPAPSDLAAIESRYPDTRAASLARFLLGYLYYSSQNYQAAVEALGAKSIGAHSALGDYAFFYRAESHAKLDSKSQARRDYESVYEKHADSLKAREARLSEAETAIAAGDPSDAIKLLTRMVEARDAEALLLTARAYEASGKNDKALALYRTIYYEVPATTAGPDAEARLAALGASVKDNPGSLDQMRSRADALYESKQYGEAARAYEELVARYAEAERIDEIQLRRGASLLYGKQPAQAVLPLTKVSGGNRDLQAESLFYQAEALRRSNRAGESGVTVDRLVREHQKTRWAEDALYNLASYLDKQGQSGGAASRYRQLLAVYPKSGYAPEASYEIGWQAYQSGNYAEAARMLEQHLSNYRYPDTKFIGEAGFWAAKSEERLGNKQRALALYDLVGERYRYGYHGHVALQRAGRLRAADSRLRPEQSPEIERIRKNVLYVEKVEETADGSEANRVAHANDFEVIGLGDLAVKELNHALAQAPASPRLNLRLAQLYSRRGENFQATLVLRKGYPDIYSYTEADVPREAWEIFFPLVSWETIKQEAKRYGIDPYIAAGLIRQESVFNPNAISRVGARGLMQVMPATGQVVSRQQGIGRISAADLYNPTINIKLGMNYLAQMMGQFGRIEYAAAAYNAGPGRARQWIAARGSLDIEDWVEQIPFTETRGYVQGVLRYAANYRRLYKD
ncbi:MAG TPA: transglycosylase SLT domain-containing protein [Blastocatellia bacterium]|nr:transglycosylase SLT domain-containing protein [Blastocatellia bacterium]